jgi:hypothetical protein
MKLLYPDCTMFNTVADLSIDELRAMAECLKLAKHKLWDGVGLGHGKESPICYAIVESPGKESCKDALYPWITAQLESATFYGMWLHRRNVGYSDAERQAARHQWLDSMVKHLEAVSLAKSAESAESAEVKHLEAVSLAKAAKPAKSTKEQPDAKS